MHSNPTVVSALCPWRAALYIRLSRDDGDKLESNSVTNQREILREHLKLHPDIVLHDIYIDDGWSGTNFNRPGFQRMMEDIYTGQVNCVIVKDLSRFCRNASEGGQYLDNIFVRYRVRFIALNNGIDTASGNMNAATQLISMGMTNVINESVAATTSVNVRGTLNVNRQQGKFIGSFPTYGYLKDPSDHHKLIIDEETAPVLDYNEGIVPLDTLIVSCGDYEPDGGASEGPANLAVDDDLSTIWHTDWYGTSRDNHWIQFELTEDYEVDGLRYKPRITGNTNSIITRYDIQVSNDGVTFESVASGSWSGDRNWKVVEFDARNVKYVRLLALDALTDNAYVFACAAEVRLTGEKAAAHEHSFGEWTVTTEATCTEKGEETRSCECGETETREIAALGHTEEIIPVDVKLRPYGGMHLGYTHSI